MKAVRFPWRMIYLALVLALAGAFALWQQSAAQTPGGTGVIEGRAVVASAGSNAPLNDLPVSLFTFISGVRQTPPAVGQTDAQGHVRFAQLSTSSNVTYTLFIKFQDTIYGSDVIAFAAGSALAQAAVKVYDSTSSDLA